jgi:isocitrate/isopropylmalate dehydrogenase
MKLKFEDFVVLAMIREPKTVEQLSKEFGITVEGMRKRLKKYVRLRLAKKVEKNPDFYICTVKSEIFDKVLSFYNLYKKFIG